jgi:hypothetical protein
MRPNGEQRQKVSLRFQCTLHQSGQLGRG